MMFKSRFVVVIFSQFLSLLVLSCSFSVFAKTTDSILDIPIPLVDDTSVTLSQYKAVKPVYLKFWASWCQPCLKEMPHFQKMYEKYGESIEVISINLGLNDSIDDVQAVVKRYGLSMPLAIDKTGELADRFNFVGTPYHLLFDANLNLIHRGHEANDSLDQKLALLAAKNTVEPISSSFLSKNEKPLVLEELTKGNSVLFFTATWCHWYLRETKNDAAKACDQAQKEFNRFAQRYPELNWVVIASNLWTSEKDLDDYAKNYSVKTPIVIDRSNSTFLKFGVKNFPEWVFIKDGRVSERHVGVLGEVGLSNFTGTHTSLKSSKPIDIVNLRMKAYNEHNLPLFLETYAPDVQIYDYPDKPLGQKGHEHLRGIFEPLFKDNAVSVKIESQIEQGRYVVNHETVMQHGQKTKYVSIYEVVGGLIQSVRFLREI